MDRCSLNNCSRSADIFVRFIDQQVYYPYCSRHDARARWDRMKQRYGSGWTPTQIADVTERPPTRR